MKKYFFLILLSASIIFFTFSSNFISSGFVFAEENLPIITTISPEEVSIDAGFNILISGNNFGFTPGEIINVNTNQKLNITSPLVSQIWQEGSIFINFDTYLIPPNLLQEGVNSFKIKMSSGAESAPFTIIGKKLGSAVITSVIPSTAHADDEIVINGSGFGTGVSGQVGTMTDYIQPFWPHQIISWSDTQIRIKLTGFSYAFAGNTNLIVAARLPDTRMYCSNLFPIKIELPICNSWTYSSWGICSANGQQTRTITNSFPETCVGGNPALTQSCSYIPACTTNDYSCGVWSTCSSNNNQTRACNKISDCEGGTSSPATTQSCTYISPCTSDTWSCGGWGDCSAHGLQNRTCNKTFDCPTATTPSPASSQSCIPPQPTCTADTWACGDWNACSPSGVQSRSCRITFDCPSVVTLPPITDQYCTPPNRLTPQTPPSGNDEVSNQDTIIKATVKLMCLFDANTGMQGSGTIIDASGLILTNKHVVNGTVGCFVGFINNLNDKPYFGDRQIADILKVSSTEDIAVLKLRNPNNQQLTYINIASGNSNLQLGTKINVYGYPAIFGTDITYTSGDFSGVDGSYLKTTAILEHGNSGGGAYSNNGTFVGIPSAVVKGQLNSLGYILSINTVNSWLGNTSNITYGGGGSNNYSRVSSILESIDLKKLGSLQFLVAGSKNTETQNQTLSQTQKKSVVVDSNNIIQETNSDQNKQNIEPVKDQPVKRSSIFERFINWISSLFHK